MNIFQHQSMETLETIFNRRSIRHYTPEKIEPGTIDTVIRAGMYAPSAVNKQPWHFIVLHKRETLEKIMDFHPYATMLKQASTAILVCWDITLQHDEGYGPIDCAAATENMLLAACSMGLGAVWVGIYPRQPRMDAMHDLFNLPDHIRAFSLLSLGYPAENKAIPQRYNPERIHHEQW